MDCHLKSRACKGEILPLVIDWDDPEELASCDFHRDRVGCCVPFCTRSYKRTSPGGRVVCGEHWRMGDKHLRKLWTILHKRGRRYGWTHARILANNRLYDRIVASAIENLMGVDNHG